MACRVKNGFDSLYIEGHIPDVVDPHKHESKAFLRQRTAGLSDPDRLPVSSGCSFPPTLTNHTLYFVYDTVLPLPLIFE